MSAWQRRLLILGAVVLSAVFLHAPSEGAVQIAARMGGAPKDSLRRPTPAPESAGTATDLLRGTYDELIAQAASEAGVDAALVQSIITIESGFDPYAVSRKGAMGLMQLMPKTALRYAVSNPFDPAANIRGGVRYLRFLGGMFPGQLHWVLAAYNAGENAVLRHNGIPPYRETQEYVQRVLADYTHRAARNRGALGLDARGEGAPELQPAAPTLTVYRAVNADSSVTYTNMAPTRTR